MLEIEKNLKNQGYDYLIGIDEAGRGPLAGPVVAAAVLLHTHAFEVKINDSKKMSALQREKAFVEINEKAIVGVGIIEPSVIDKENILNATFIAMNEALSDLLGKLKEDEASLIKNMCLLIDGNRFRTRYSYVYKTIVGGDSKVISIACASIIAKVTRDAIMIEYDKVFPEYGFLKHKGYPTKLHKEALRKFGLTKIHRKSFKY